MAHGNENGLTARPEWVKVGATVRTMAGALVVIVEVLPTAPSMVRVQDSGRPWTSAGRALARAAGDTWVCSWHDLREVTR